MYMCLLLRIVLLFFLRKFIYCLKNFLRMNIIEKMKKNLIMLEYIFEINYIFFMDFFVFR